jgi:hypothetical protein
VSLARLFVLPFLFLPRLLLARRRRSPLAAAAAASGR